VARGTPLSTAGLGSRRLSAPPPRTREHPGPARLVARRGFAFAAALVVLSLLGREGRRPKPVQQVAAPLDAATNRSEGATQADPLPEPTAVSPEPSIAAPQPLDREDPADLLEDRPWERPPEDGLSRTLRAGAAVAVFALCALIVWHVAAKLLKYGFGDYGALYTITVTSYVFSRFLLAALYRPPRDVGLEPSVAIVVPAYNEGEAVARTIHSCLTLDYPQDKLEVVVINDGSSDDTWEQMHRAAAHYDPGRVRCVDLGSNQGKRAAMAEGIRQTSAEILVFVDSDSMPAPGAVRKLVQGFADEKVGAISGLTYVRNASRNTLTRMQAARYYVSFQLLKAAESVVNAVSCCSGCFAAYRREAVLPLLERWEHQRFLGVECTYGDDRALTNMILRARWKAIYDAEAEAWTDAPHQYPKFFRQQLRWKKSWAREGPILASHLWRTRPIAFPAAVCAAMSGICSPLVVLWNLAAQPTFHGVSPTFYMLCLYLMSLAYALLYRALREDGIWLYAILATFFYVSFSPQLVWAIARIRDGKWGTRDEDVLPPEAAGALPVGAATS
jgi:hyaluronan synthase